MKIHLLKVGKNPNLYETFHPEIGDVELWDDGEVYLVLDSDYYHERTGPEFGGDIATADPRQTFEEITDYVKVIKRTKIAEKLNKGNIWKENEKWLVIKK